jgi:branched-chain amino acid transport system substrate-binding protein
MKMNMALMVVVAVLFGTAVQAQSLEGEYPRAESLFVHGQQLLEQKDFAGAVDAFRELVSGFKNSRYRDLYNYSLARAYYFAGDFAEAAVIAQEYPVLFPSSGLNPYARYLLGNARYRQGQIADAFTAWCETYRTADKDRLRDLAGQSLVSQIDAGFFPDDSLMSQVPGQILCDIKRHAANLMSGRWSNAERKDFLGSCPDRREEPTRKKKNDQGELVVGIMLPLSGPYEQFGKAILDGALLAAEHFDKRGAELSILAYDTKADNVLAARQALALTDMHADVIIGPLLSDVSATVAAALSCQKIPLLVPAATQAGFTELSPACFQMTPNLAMIAKGMAQYAVKNRGMSLLAVITPTTPEELMMSDIFANEAERLGATVVAIERFRPDESDFGPYIKDLKESIIGPPADSVFYVTMEGDTLRAGEMPVSLDGIFIPATEDQLHLILPQLDFFRIRASYLGTDHWEKPKVRNLGPGTLKDAVFYSSSGSMRYSPKYDDFAALYDSRYGGQPERLSAVGFDAVNMVRDAVQTGATSAKDITAYLSSLIDFVGASGVISFGASHTNRHLPLFAFDEGKIKPLVNPPRVNETDSISSSLDSIGTQYIKYDY